MSVELWIVISIVTYSLSTTSIALRKMGYLKAADIIDIILTFGAAAMMNTAAGTVRISAVSLHQ